MNNANSQTITGTIKSEGKIIPFVNVTLGDNDYSVVSDKNGEFKFDNISVGNYYLTFTSLALKQKKINIFVNEGVNIINVSLLPSLYNLNQVVITGSMKPVSKMESPVPVEVYTNKFFKINPSPSLYESLQNVNGVRPQNNCAVCNTGDIHINGLEGPYTMVLIDGMPIVSGLSTVYGLNGIPQSLIKRVEVVKGPASTLYGSEAVGGLINIITKSVDSSPIFSSDLFCTSLSEINSDLSTKFKIGNKYESLLALNYFRFKKKIDLDDDNFTDITLQDRISLFNKWSFKRSKDRIFTIAGRYIYEDRFGGDINWSTNYRGGDIIYGESIYTSRWEFFGIYQLPLKEKITFQFSANEHDQNSVYGDSWYLANQKIGFGQLLWDKRISKNYDLLTGFSMRYTYYDDNTPATSSFDTLNSTNLPIYTYLPGIFLQNEVSFNDYNRILLGMRFDYNSIHGRIITPRINYKWTSKNKLNIVRFSLGNGFRVANIFNEDHAALTGSREVIIESDLSPEKSYNGNINYVKKIYAIKDLFVVADASVFYTYFDNKILPDYDSNTSKIIYKNLSGYAVSKGISANIDIVYRDFNAILGFTLMDVFSVQNGIRKRQELTEQFTATWSMVYNFRKIGMSFNYSGNLYSPMDLPTQTTPYFSDPRSPNSPWYSIQNLTLEKHFGNELELYAGIKNLLNWNPWKSLGGIPYLGNPNDPFNQNTNPNSLVFDPSYVYGPNKGIRVLLGVRYLIN